MKILLPFSSLCENCGVNDDFALTFYGYILLETAYEVAPTNSFVISMSFDKTITRNIKAKRTLSAVR